MIEKITLNWVMSSKNTGNSKLKIRDTKNHNTFEISYILAAKILWFAHTQMRFKRKVLEKEVKSRYWDSIIKDKPSLKKSIPPNEG